MKFSTRSIRTSGKKRKRDSHTFFIHILSNKFAHLHRQPSNSSESKQRGRGKGKTQPNLGRFITELSFVSLKYHYLESD